MEDLYCKLFVDTTVRRPELVKLIASHLDGDIQGHFVSATNLEIGAKENDDYDPNLCDDPENGFLFYPIYLEIDPTDNAGMSNYINDVAKLINILRTQGFKAVAACDFEDQLP